MTTKPKRTKRKIEIEYGEARLIFYKTPMDTINCVVIKPDGEYTFREQSTMYVANWNTFADAIYSVLAYFKHGGK